MSDTLLYIIIGIVTGVLAVIVVAYFIGKAKIAQNPENGLPPAPPLTDEDRVYFKEMMGIDPDEYPDFVEAMLSVSASQGFSLREFSEQHPELVAGYWHNVGQSYFNDGDFKTAASSFTKAIHIHVTHNTEENEFSAQCRCNLGVALQELGLSKDALEQFNQSLDYNRKNSGDDSEQNAILIHNIGWAHEGLGDKEKASEHYQQALDMCKRLDFKDGIEILQPKIDNMKKG